MGKGKGKGKISYGRPMGRGRKIEEKKTLPMVAEGRGGGGAIYEEEEARDEEEVL